MLALQAITPERLTQPCPAITLAEARKLIAQVHRGEPVRATLGGAPQSRQTRCARPGSVPALAVVAETPSAIDPFVKYLLEAPDGARFEAVRIPLEQPGRFTACVSSQVGCALACAFCATGRLGLTRNLAAWEIVEQVRIVRARLPSGRVHGVVFQGMGEPLANLDAVLDAIAVLTEPCALGIDARAITVCTAGLPVGIRRLAREAPNVRLGLSIGSARPDAPQSLMPIARAHALDEVLAAVAEHARATGLSPMWAVTLLAGVNDSDDDARALADRARAFEAATGMRPALSIIAVQRDRRRRSVPRSPREASFARRSRDCREPPPLLRRRRRRAACGQLAARG